MKDYKDNAATGSSDQRDKVPGIMPAESTYAIACIAIISLTIVAVIFVPHGLLSDYGQFLGSSITAVTLICLLYQNALNQLAVRTQLESIETLRQQEISEITTRSLQNIANGIDALRWLDDYSIRDIIRLIKMASNHAIDEEQNGNSLFTDQAILDDIRLDMTKPFSPSLYIVRELISKYDQYRSARAELKKTCGLEYLDDGDHALHIFITELGNAIRQQVL